VVLPVSAPLPEQSRSVRVREMSHAEGCPVTRQQPIDTDSLRPMDDRQGIRRRDPTSKHLGDAGTPDTQGPSPRMLSPITQNKFYPI